MGKKKPQSTHFCVGCGFLMRNDFQYSEYIIVVPSHTIYDKFA